MHENPFEELQATIASGDVASTFDRLIERLRSNQQYFELFDALLMQSRWRLGLPVVFTGSFEDLADPLRNQLEEAYVKACREVGSLLLTAGKIREAWVYLRPLGDNELVAKTLEKTEPTDENINTLVEVALHEGVAVALGYRLVLEHFGTCNAITMYEGIVRQRPRSDQQSAAALLVRHVHRELVANLRAAIARHEGREPTESNLVALIANREGLFGPHNYHIDTTHLASTVRIAQVVQDPDVLSLAWELTDYGRRLDPQFQFPGDEPFHDLYPSHGLFFRALVGQQVDEALDYFRQRAEQLAIEEVGSLPAEVYIYLLDRLGRFEEAMRVVRRLPTDARTTGFAPSLLELSARAGNYTQLMEACQERGNLVGFTAGLVAAYQKAQ